MLKTHNPLRRLLLGSLIVVIGAGTGIFFQNWQLHYLERAQASCASPAWTKHVISGTYDTAQGMYATDIDGDLDMDIVSTAFSQNDVTWWENDGSETFTEYTIAGSFSGAHDVHAIDVDADGDIDVIGAGFVGDQIGWWENDGSENFSEHIIDSNFDGAQGVHAIDVDGDADIDILGAAFGTLFSGEITWWENDGSENFTEHTIDTSFYGGEDVHAIDVDGDSDIDILGATFFASEITWWENDGFENFTKRVIQSGYDGTEDVDGSDVDGDGDIDVLGTSTNLSEITWWENDGSENFTEHTIDAAFNGARGVQATDVDGDGDVDVIGGSVYDGVSWWENDGSENFAGSTVDASFSAADIFTIDMDGDGDADILGTDDAADDLVWWEQTCAANTDQLHFRWRDDTTALNTDGGWLAAEDAHIADGVEGTTYRLRFDVANTGDAAEAGARSYQIQFGEKSTTCAAIGSWAALNEVGDAFELVDSSNFSSGQATTALFSNSEGYTFTAGEGLDTNDASGPVGPMNASVYTEMEYSIQATTSAVGGMTYCFRLYDFVASTLDTYTVYPEMTILESDTDQLHFRWRDDTTALNTDGGWLAAQDSAITDAVQGDTYRIRMEVANAGGSAESAARTYKIQYGEKSTTCSAIGSWTDVDTSNAFEMSDSAEITNGAATTALLTNSESYTFIAGKGQDTSNTTASIGPMNADTYTEIEYSVTPTTSTSANTSYCFRLYDTTAGSALDTYTQYPSLIIGAPTTDQLHFRWRDDTTALNTDGGWLAAEDTAITDAVQGDTYRIRMEVANTGEAIEAAARTYKVQYGVKATTCAAIGSWTDVDTGNAFTMSDSGQITNGGATTALLTNSESYTFTAGKGQDTGNTTAAIGPMNPSAYTEIEYGITPTTSTTANTAYCFRLYDTTDGAVLDTYSQYPSLTIGNPETNQLHYRWSNDSYVLNSTDANRWLAAADTAVSDVIQGDTYRIRMEVANTGEARESSAKAYQLQYGVLSTTCAAIGSWTNVSASSDAIDMVETSQFVNLDATTAVLANSEGYGFVAGQGLELQDQSDAIGPLTVQQYTELEFSIKPTASAPASTTYCLRLINVMGGGALDAYTSYPTFTVGAPDTTQLHFRFRDDTIALNTDGGWLAAADTAITDVTQGDTYRIRVEVANTGEAAEAAVRTYKIQFGERSTTCGAIGTWTDVDAGNAFTMNDSTQITNGAATTALLANSESYTFTAGTGQDTGNTTASIGPMNASTYTEIEYSIKPTAMSFPNTTYCFRLYDTTAGATLDTYTQYPSLTIGAPTNDQLHYRWRDDTAALNVSSGWLAAEDTAIGEAVTTSTYRLRVEVANRGDAVEEDSRTYKLQFGEKSTTCSAIGSWTDVDASNAFELSDSANFTHGDATTALLANSESYTFTAGEGLDTSNTSSAIGPLETSQYTEFEYSISPSDSVGSSTTYCFRLYDTTAGSALDAYSQYPELTTDSPAVPTPVTVQLSYRWRDDSTALNTDGGWLAAEDTAIADVRQDATRRIRIRVANTGNGQESAARTYKIQYGQRATTCGAIGSWTDVNTGNAFIMTGSMLITNGEATSALLSNAQGYTFTVGAAQDTSNTSGSIGPLGSEYTTELEYSIEPTTNASAEATYCFRLYDTTAGAALDTYTEYPSLTIGSANTNQLHFRWRDDTAGLNDDNGWLAVEDTAITGVVQGDTYRIRIEVANTGEAAQSVGKNYQIQYGEKSTTCSAIGTWTALEDASDEFGMVASAMFTHLDTTTQLFANSEEYTFVTGYGLSESDHPPDVLTALNASSFMEIEYSFTPTTDTAAGTTYCLRLYDLSGGSALDTYTQYPELTIGDPLTKQLHFRWRDDTAALNADSGWLAAQDTAIADVTQGETYRVRLSIANAGGAVEDPRSYQLQFGERSTTCSAIGSWTNVGEGGGAFDMSDTAQFVNGAATTALMANGEGYTFAAGQGADTTDTMGPFTALSPNAYREMEYSITANTSASASTSYCFRIYDFVNSQVLDSYDAYPQLTIGNPTTDQLHFRWRDDTTTLNTDGGWLAVEDIAIADAVQSDTYRLRVAVANTGQAQESAARTYKLQFGEKSTTCSAIGSWTDVDVGNAFTVSDSSYITNGESTSALLSNSESYTFTAGTGQDTGNTTASIGPMSNSTYTEIEYSITPTTSASASTTYCFRLYDTTAGGTLDTYSQYPSLTVGSPTTDQLHYRWRDDTSALNTDGGWLAAEDTAITDALEGDTYRIRMEVANTGEAQESAARTYKIQYGEKSTTCSAIGSWTDVDAGNAFTVSDSSYITNGEATSALLTNAESYSFTAGEGHDTGNTTGSIGPMDVGTYTELEYSITPSTSASTSVTYCFRLYDTAATATLDTYSAYPQTTVEFCGNGTIEAASGEECDDGNGTGSDGCTNCLVDSGYTCLGEPSTCTIIIIDEIPEEEGYCGDRIVQDGEECEPPGTETCANNCLYRTSGGTKGGDEGEDVPTGPTVPKVSIDTIVFCGNGKVDAGEECDAGYRNGLSTSDCTKQCKALACGDGVLSVLRGEECEPDFVLTSEGERIYEEMAECTTDPTDLYCTPPDDSDGGCLLREIPLCIEEEVPVAPFEKQPYCGDGRVNGEEECDAGGICLNGKYHNAVWEGRIGAILCRNGGGESVARSGDGCSDTCLLEYCGDGVLQPGEQCDNASVCSNAIDTICRSDADCGEDATCTYNFWKTSACTDGCQLCRGLYVASIPMEGLRDGEHTLKLLVRNDCGAVDIAETHFIVSSTLVPRAETQPIHETPVLLSDVNPEERMGFAPPVVSVITDKRTYLRGFDESIRVSGIVVDGYGAYLGDLPAEAFTTAIDGGIIDGVVFTETSAQGCESLIQNINLLYRNKCGSSSATHWLTARVVEDHGRAVIADERDRAAVIALIALACALSFVSIKHFRTDFDA
ncbi:hypothetical protein COU80_05475 [Candidatus Peregrinibacteria bacterium CG10_big_fil_rev_8_21_14_0_10_55_24]|nr:MAG: hypothetical protein COU80_05475 [Candidatus Peregrinibacteria bacterium CG10_big_fil_rev_8_21_14_0_10_55_24]